MNTKMHIGILTTDNGEEDKRLMEAAIRRGHHARLLHLVKCSISVCPENPGVYYEGTPIAQELDLVIPRIDTEHTEYGLTILRQFQSMHIFASDCAQAIALGRDKLRCAQRLLRDNIPFPPTGYAYSTEDFDTIIQTVGGMPIIIKLIQGTEGIGVFLAQDMKQAVNLLKTFKQLATPLIVQKFIKESAGHDIRAFIIDGKVVASMQRFSQDEDFRANIALGGTSEPITLSALEEEIALKAAHAIGIHVAGVDLIRSDNGPLVIEINVSPGFTALEAVTGTDIAGQIIDFAIRKKQEVRHRPLTGTSTSA